MICMVFLMVCLEIQVSAVLQRVNCRRSSGAYPLRREGLNPTLTLQLPSARQLKFAVDIAQELGVDLPAEALRYRGVCADFIERFIEPFKTKRAGRFVRSPTLDKLARVSDEANADRGVQLISDAIPI